MSKSNNLTDFLTDLADGLRGLTDTTNTIDPQDFRGVIDDTKNGIDSQVDILVDIQAALENKALPDVVGGTINISANGVYDVSTYETANVNVASGGTCSHTTKTVTPSKDTKTYKASSDGYGGYSQFTVNGDSDLVASNIRSGVNIFGVTGTYSAGTVSGTKTITSTSKTDVSTYQYAQVSDSNLIASNIKSGVSILGITGTYGAIRTKSVRIYNQSTEDIEIRYANGSRTVIETVSAESSRNITAVIDSEIWIEMSGMDIEVDADRSFVGFPSESDFVASYGEVAIVVTDDSTTTIYVSQH